MNILLVAEERDDCDRIQDLLRTADADHCVLRWMQDGESARQALRGHEFDVCLVDCRPPSHSGRNLLRWAGQEAPAVPMIALGTLEDRQQDLEAMQAGAVDFLVYGRLEGRSLERALRFAVERARSGRELRHLAGFASFNPDPVMHFTAGGQLAYYNGAARELATTLGYDSPSALLPPETPSIVKQCLTSREMKLELQTLVSRRTLSWSFFRVPNLEIVHCSATDLTDRMALESQLRHAQKLEAVGQLAAGVAHDFNNILTIIEGHAAMLAHTHAPNAPCTRPLQEIRDAAERAGNLIRQLLMFGRKQVLQPRPLDLNLLVESAVTTLRRTLGEHIRLLVKTSPGLPMIHADPVVIEQVLANLAGNAKDAMPNGGLLMITTRCVQVSPETARRNAEARAGEFVTLAVSDTGCGMPPETLNHIFEPFFTTKEVGKGSGLGLATVYGAVKQHKGWIDVHSEVGRGTAFSLHFPVNARSASSAPLPPSPQTGSAPERGRETILVAEDEPALRELVAQILEFHGYQVFSASSGREAIEVWTEHRHEIDMLITDMAMPGMLGSELAERLHQQNPELRVIFTSGYSPGMAGKDLALLDGINFLPKPYPPSKLVQLVRECLDASPRASRLCPAQ